LKISPALVIFFLAPAVGELLGEMGIFFFLKTLGKLKEIHDHAGLKVQH
jgi:hypothetical protein